MIVTRFSTLGSCLARQGWNRIQTVPLRTHFATSSKHSRSKRNWFTERLGSFANLITKGVKTGRNVGSPGLKITLGMGGLFGIVLCGAFTSPTYNEDESDPPDSQQSSKWTHYVKQRIMVYSEFCGFAAYFLFSAPLIYMTYIQGEFNRKAWISAGALLCTVMIIMSYVHDDIRVSTAKYWALAEHATVVTAIANYSHVCMLRVPRYILVSGLISGAVSGLWLSTLAAPSENFWNVAAPLGIVFGTLSFDMVLYAQTPLPALYVYGMVGVASLLMLLGIQYVIKDVQKRPDEYQITF